MNYQHNDIIITKCWTSKYLVRFTNCFLKLYFYITININLVIKKFDSVDQYNEHLYNGNLLILDEKYLYGEVEDEDKESPCGEDSESDDNSGQV